MEIYAALLVLEAQFTEEIFLYIWEIVRVTDI